MRKQLFLKCLTIASSVILVTGFLLYRSGSLNDLLSEKEHTHQNSPNGGAITTSKTDTTKNRKDSLKLVKDSISNSTVVINKWLSDTSKLSAEKKEEKPAIQQERVRMFSSKSGSVLRAPDLKISIDSFHFKYDSLKKKKP